jgi:DMSO reductase anchor subunit
MNRLTQLIFTIAVIVVGVWLLALVFRLATWMINGLLYVAAVVIIVGLISAYVQGRKQKGE